MKKIIPVLLALSLASCASHPVQKPGGKLAEPKYVNLMDSNNKLVASVDTNNGHVQYYESPERAFEVLFASYIAYVNQQTKPAALPPIAPKPKVKK